MSDSNNTTWERPDPPPGPATPSHIGRYRVERVLGRGGFGLVYLAHDDELRRLVAVKVPHPARIARTTDADAYLAEARAVARLDHPHIVPVYDAGRTDDFPCYVVSKFIDGSDLSGRLKSGERLSIAGVANLVATVADALHHAHTHGLVHRDVKPGNLLLDRAGRPFVADFGLALREQDTGTGSGYAGTPSYMSPEQARGEGHRVDGRSDVFSLGVVFYELLAGRRPFRADSVAELLEQVATHEPRPLRQSDENIPKELERICFKALAKRASERYLTARDLADDLRHFLGGSTHEPSRPSELTVLVPPSSPAPDSTPTPVVPKGLRAFDATDADFFLELLPGPRGRDGLPDSLRFWKARIEETDADATFPIGLVYGPSGCGKSSLVKAGLLPRLAKTITTVYAEATGEQTETRLLKALRRALPALPAEMGLTDTLAAIRRGRFLPPGQKVLLVLDQFEQWLHAHRHEEAAELVQALRQCDGGRLQAAVLVRDDFWMAATGFMRAVEVSLREGENSAAVDLFPVRHAEKVLTAFGRAFGELPAAAGTESKEQKQFVEQAVAGLAQDGKVIPVRLALFAEMVKGKPWTPATLRAVGGTAGVGVAFLDETFAASTAPPPHRLHQKAAQGVLRALLPAADTDIKGHMRSERELLDASGYAARPKDFADLVLILDGELRLITPTDPEGKDAPSVAGERYYQLTHDFLVPSLRDWLTRKQKETRRGRAALLLADRAAVWSARPENRQLPSLWQWLSLRVLTRQRNWTPPERAMMRRAGRYHVVRTAAVAVVLILLGAGSWWEYGRLRANTLRDRLMESTTADAPAVVAELAPYRRWADPLLRESFAKAEGENDRRRQLHASLGLLPNDPSQVDYLYERMLTGDPQEVVVIRDALIGHKEELTERLWAEAENKRTDSGRRLRAACALAEYTPDDRRWAGVSEAIAGTLVNQKPFEIAAGTHALQGAGGWLLPPLAEFLKDTDRSYPERGVIAGVYGAFAAVRADGFDLLEAGLAPPAVPPKDESDQQARVRADFGVALLVMGREGRVWPLLAHCGDPTVRSYMVEGMAPAGVDARLLLGRLGEEADVGVRRALLLALGGYRLDQLPKSERAKHVPRLLALYRDDPDPGVHAAAGWLLRSWGAGAELDAIDKTLPVGGLDWWRGFYRTRQGQTMVVVPAPGEVRQGDPGEQHRRRIDRTFAIGSTEVTIAQFRRFAPRHEFNHYYAPSTDCPANENIFWYVAAAYCNWLSEKEGIPKDQWCYLPNKDGEYAAGMRTAPDHLKRTGYRLPTEAEWEYAGRAGTRTVYSFGRPAELLHRYGWFESTAVGKSHPVGTLRPNDLGLFDTHGNVWEWCQDAFHPLPKTTDDKLVPDPEGGVIDDDTNRVLRGGGYNNPPLHLHSTNRNEFPPAKKDDNAVGFRVARTMPAEKK